MTNAAKACVVKFLMADFPRRGIDRGSEPQPPTALVHAVGEAFELLPSISIHSLDGDGGSSMTVPRFVPFGDGGKVFVDLLAWIGLGV